MAIVATVAPLLLKVEKINVKNNWKKFHYFESNGILLEMIGTRFDKVI